MVLKDAKMSQIWESGLMDKVKRRIKMKVNSLMDSDQKVNSSIQIVDKTASAQE